MIRLVPEEIEAYADRQTTPVPELLEELREVTYRTMKSPQMQVGAVEGRLLNLLVRITGSRRGIEVGMFTGYSALMMAEGLPDDGELITCDVNPDAEAVARSFFARSPHGHKIHPRIAPALATLATLRGPFDFAFIDADKRNYVNYYEAVLPLIRAGGWIAADNTLWSGEVLRDDADRDDDTRALVAFSRHVADDDRTTQVLLTIRDGLTLIWKNP
ncbi:MAG: class I SAM-dependent methyltransferase [Acidobacteriota bacterium]|jgi:caffeoyl-CoA O-methyltransferase